jgi:hypothetical protein
VRDIYETLVVKNKILLRQDILEKFILKIVNVYIENFDKIEDYLILTGTQLTQRIIEKIFLYFGSVRLIHITLGQ